MRWNRATRRGAKLKYWELNPDYSGFGLQWTLIRRATAKTLLASAQLEQSLSNSAVATQQVTQAIRTIKALPMTSPDPVDTQHDRELLEELEKFSAQLAQTPSKNPGASPE